MTDSDEIKVPQINAQQLKEMLESATPPFLLDVREQWEVAQGMIPGARHIPMNSIPKRFDEVPRDQTVVVYCAAGVRSDTVAAYLLQIGYAKVLNLDGGIGAWEQLRHKRS
ncbi:MAG TPA: rhodanese-like domain-containing protein [Anaerolineales bacterium]|nr:rhodanese-like domain-containing protein [Anaerolineales bacterium]